MTFERGTRPVWRQKKPSAQGYKTWVATEPFKTLKQGDIVVLVNAGSHKPKAVHAIVECCGSRLFFFSPDDLILPTATLFEIAISRRADAVHYAVAIFLEDVTPFQVHKVPR